MDNTRIDIEVLRKLASRLDDLANHVCEEAYNMFEAPHEEAEELISQIEDISNETPNLYKKLSEWKSE